MNLTEKIDQLKWEPRIGDNYYKINPKLMIIGESHYYTSEKSKEEHEDPGFTNMIINSLAIRLKSTSSKMFLNMTKALNLPIAINCESDRKQFWENVAFMNIVQKPMNTSKENPSRETFIEGWDALLKVIELTTPDYLLFFGKEASNSFSQACSNNNINKSRKEELKKVNNCIPIRTSLELDSGKTVNLLFVRHPSAYFKPDEWRDFLYSSEFKEPLLKARGLES